MFLNVFRICIAALISIYSDFVSVVLNNRMKKYKCCLLNVFVCSLCVYFCYWHRWHTENECNAKWIRRWFLVMQHAKIPASNLLHRHISTHTHTQWYTCRRHTTSPFRTTEDQKNQKLKKKYRQGEFILMIFWFMTFHNFYHRTY